MTDRLPEAPPLRSPRLALTKSRLSHLFKQKASLFDRFMLLFRCLQYPIDSSKYEAHRFLEITTAFH
jgi:hypothetical protein